MFRTAANSAGVLISSAALTVSLPCAAFLPEACEVISVSPASQLIQHRLLLE